MKRKVFYTITALLVIVVAIIATCNIIVNNNAKGRVFDNPAEVRQSCSEQVPRAVTRKNLICSSKHVSMLQLSFTRIINTSS